KNEFDASKLEIDFEVLGGCEKKWGQCPHFPAIEAALGRLAECSALKVASALGKVRTSGSLLHHNQPAHV
ncbi:hypothetical protein ACE1BH_15875, partial [Aeromonas jandaei]